MKKSLAIIFTIVMLISFVGMGYSGIMMSADATDYTLEVTFSDIVDIYEAGANVHAGDNSMHGGHQTRNVHTSHGDYAAYITNTVKDMNQFSVIKINDDGTTTVLFQEYKIYDTSQVGLFVDSDENVWAVTVGSNNFKDQFDNRPAAIIAAAYRIDKETNETACYNVLVPKETSDGYGYSSFCYDEVNEKIYTLTSSGNEPGYLTWLIFDIETKTWENEARAIKTNNRQCYHYIYADGKGGMFVVNERDIRASSAGYPEIGNNHGLTDAELATFPRWSADYLWDQLELYYIPDVTEVEVKTLMVEEADFSRVTGTQEERYSLAGRLTNEYPNIQNNKGGDTFVDADGYLHVTYAKEFLLAASTRATTERTWYHATYDISDPNNMKLLSKKAIVDDSKLDYNCSFRMYQDSKGQLYYVSGETDKATGEGNIVLYKLDGDVNNGYERTKVAEKEILGDHIIHISNDRSNSTADDSFGVLYPNRKNDYNYLMVDIEYKPASDPIVGQNGLIYVWFAMFTLSVAGLVMVYFFNKKNVLVK